MWVIFQLSHVTSCRLHMHHVFGHRFNARPNICTNNTRHISVRVGLKSSSRIRAASWNDYLLRYYGSLQETTLPQEFIVSAQRRRRRLGRIMSTNPLHIIITNRAFLIQNEYVCRWNYFVRRLVDFFEPKVWGGSSNAAERWYKTIYLSVFRLG